MKNVTTTSRNVTIASVLKIQGIEKLYKYELSKVKGGSEHDEPPVMPD